MQNMDMPIVDGEFIDYREWFPQNAPNRGKYDDYFMQYNSTAPEAGTPVVGYKLFYRSPYKSNLRNLSPGRLYGVMAKGIDIDVIAAHGGAQGRVPTEDLNPAPLEDRPYPEAIDGIGNGISNPFIEDGINHTDLPTGFFMWPTRDLAEKYMQSLLQAQQDIENPRAGASAFTYRSDDTVSFNPLDSEESLLIERGHYELHRVTGVAMKTNSNVAGWQLNDMVIDPEVLVDMRSDEPSLAIHHNYLPPPIPKGAWEHR